MKKNLKIPTIFGLFILVLGLAAGLFLINSQKIFKLGAEGEAEPKNIRVGNITDTSLAVTWSTDIPSKGFIKWGNTKNLNKTSVEESPDLSEVHMVTINDISPNSTVYFAINNNGKDYLNSNIPWQAQTLTQKPASLNTLTATGVVLKQDGLTPIKSIVNLTINGTVLSTLTSDQGSWVIPISSFIDTPDDSTVVQIEVNAGLHGVSQATIYPQGIKNTPIMLLNKTYDFRTIDINNNNGQQPESKLTVPDLINQSSRFEIDKTSQTEIKPVTLDSIKEGEIITTQNPELFGQAPANAIIEVSVESELQSASIQANNDGDWKWNIPNNLEEGEHLITLKWKDENGIIRTVTRNFVVSASEGPAFVATPSATLRATATPTDIPNENPTTTPTAQVTPTQTAQPLPETGYLTNTLGLFMIGVGLLLTSYYVSKKSFI